MLESIKLFAGLACAFACITVVQADVISIGVSADTSIFSEATNNSAGGAPAIFAGTNNIPAARRGLLEFNVAGAVPAGSTITGVQLTLYLAQVAGSGQGGGGGSPTIGLFPLTNSWGEGTAGSTFTLPNQVGQGVAAGNGDATWANRFYSPTAPTAWTTAGGDATGTASASLQIVGTTVNTAYNWLSTAATVADVQGWLDNPSSNDGWLLKNANEASMQTFRAFWSREAAMQGGANVHPSLAITYTSIPEPTTLVLIGLPAFMFGRRRLIARDRDLAR